VSRRACKIAALVGWTLVAPAAADSPTPGRVVWHGVLDHTNTGPKSRAANHVEFRQVEETQPDGGQLVRSDTVTWRTTGEAWIQGAVVVETATGRRSRGDWSVQCEGGGSVDRTRSDASQAIDAGKPRCLQSPPDQRYRVFGKPWPNVWGSPGNPRPISLDQLGGGCSWSAEKTWPDGSGGTNTQKETVWVSELDAVVEFSARDAQELARFLPVPGRWITVTVRSNVPTLFRFEIDDVTRYPGFATNANVDDAFFLRSGLAPLRGRYKNGDPDFIFDPWSYEGQSAWKWNGWTSVETTKASSAATVFVTAMDFAARGRVRVLAKGHCRGWEPAEVRMGGRSRGYLVLPIDENDDLMADALLEYAGDPGRDDERGWIDQDFPKDAKAGDGLTALEEYRGFMVAGEDCRQPLRDVHQRTDPTRRDLFVHATHAALAAAVRIFGDSAAIDAHLICKRHYVDDVKRVVNATLPDAGLRRFHGYGISQSEPQHGLLLENHRFEDDCGPGRPCPLGVLGKASTWGPPKLVSWVRVDVDRNLHSGFRPGPAKLLNTVTHELGHALGIRHHGDGNSLVPIVVLERTSCPASTRKGTVKGKGACEYAFVAARHAENSGDQDCPMKYVFWSWYVPPKSKLERVGDVEFVARRADGSEQRVQRVGYRLTGMLRSYETREDYFGLGAFCSSQQGTGINALLPEDRNHAGNSTRNCAQQLRVSDVY
jgi:hypothetical protein